MVAGEDERVDFHLFAALHIVGDYQAPAGVGPGERGHLHPGVAFVDVVAFYFVAAGAQQVLGHHVARGQFHLFPQFVGFAFFHPLEFEVFQPGAFFEHYFEEYQAALHSGDSDLHIFKHALFPEVFDGSRDAVARQGDAVAHLQAGHQLHHSGVEVLRSFKGDAAYFVALGGEVVEVVAALAAHHSLGIHVYGA